MPYYADHDDEEACVIMLGLSTSFMYQMTCVSDLLRLYELAEGCWDDGWMMGDG